MLIKGHNGLNVGIDMSFQSAWLCVRFKLFGTIAKSRPKWPKSGKVGKLYPRVLYKNIIKVGYYILKKDTNPSYNTWKQ